MSANSKHIKTKQVLAHFLQSKLNESNRSTRLKYTDTKFTIKILIFSTPVPKIATSEVIKSLKYSCKERESSLMTSCGSHQTSHMTVVMWGRKDFL